MMPLRDRLEEGSPLLFDGPTGTELHRRGVDTSLPLWSARALLTAPDVLRAVHRDYLEAGAEVITANTFRTHERSLAAGGQPGQGAELTLEAVEIAREVAGDRAYVAGSLAPLEDCYRPDLVPDRLALLVEHDSMARNLARSGADLILVETHNTVREAVAAARAAATTALPVLVSFVVGRDAQLLSGESVAEAVQAVLPFEPTGLLVNCGPAPDLLPALLQIREAAPGIPFGAYGNVGYADDRVGWVSTDAVDPQAYADHAESWMDAGATIVGSCCGTGPDHVRALRRRIDARLRAIRPSP